MSEPDWHGWADQLATGLAEIDPQLCLGWINRALAERLERGARSLQGQPLTALLPAQVAQEQARRALAEDRPVQLRQVALNTVRGEQLLADVTLQPVGACSLLLEVHVLVDAAVTPSPLSATLRGFAHEVKNPLAGLRGAAQLLQRRVAEPSLQALAGRVIEEADRLDALANRLLHHEGAVRLAQVNIHSVLDRAVALLRAAPAPPAVRQDYDPSLPELWGDADRLQQVILNLVRNAVEAGASTLTLRTRAAYRVRAGGTLLRSALQLDVIDDGAGVPAALHGQLFQPLVSGRADGTGLGLALSREIAREHGGELLHQAGAGATTFSLVLPMPRARGHDV